MNWENPRDPKIDVFWPFLVHECKDLIAADLNGTYLDSIIGTDQIESGTTVWSREIWQERHSHFVLGYSDPYVVIAGAGPNQKTSVKDKNLNPVWNESYELYEARKEEI